MRENVFDRVPIGFGLTSDWVKNWREIYKPIMKRAECITNYFSVASWLVRSPPDRAVWFGALGPVSRKPRKVFGPVKPFLDHLYLKTEKCIRSKLLV